MTQREINKLLFRVLIQTSTQRLFDSYFETEEAARDFVDRISHAYWSSLTIEERKYLLSKYPPMENHCTFALSEKHLGPYSYLIFKEPVPTFLLEQYREQHGIEFQDKEADKAILNTLLNHR